MLDLNKPIRRKRDKKPATVIASGVTQAIPGLQTNTVRREQDTLLVSVDGVLGYYQPSGQFACSPGNRDLENYEEAITVTRGYRLADGRLLRDDRLGHKVNFEFDDGRLIAVSLADEE